MFSVVRTFLFQIFFNVFLWNSLRFRWSIPSFRLIFMGNGLFLSFVS